MNVKKLKKKNSLDIRSSYNNTQNYQQTNVTDIFCFFSLFQKKKTKCIYNSNVRITILCETTQSCLSLSSVLIVRNNPNGVKIFLGLFQANIFLSTEKFVFFLILLFFMFFFLSEKNS